MSRIHAFRIILACSAVFTFSVFSIGANKPAPSSTATVSSQSLQLTIEELSKYDGKEGRNAYVAIDSVIYDVTKIKAWKNGEHKMGLTAGNDLSDKIGSAPHGKKILTKLPKVGILVTRKATPPVQSGISADTAKVHPTDAPLHLSPSTTK